MKRVILNLLAGLFAVVLMSGLVYGEVEIKDNIKISGQGNHITFPNQSAQGTALPKVYDASGNFLGISQGFFIYNSVGTFMVYDITIYLPSIQKMLIMSLQSGDIDGLTTNEHFYYTSTDCSGTAYMTLGKASALSRDGASIVTGNNSILPAQITAKSHRPNGGSCIMNDWSSPTVVETLDITAQMPFTLPVAVPLQFK